MAIRLEGERGNPSVSGDVLILLADQFAQQVDFNVTRLFGQFPLRHVILRVGVQRGCA
jgi:hypothetical protein